MINNLGFSKFFIGLTTGNVDEIFRGEWILTISPFMVFGIYALFGQQMVIATFHAVDSH